MTPPRRLPPRPPTIFDAAPGFGSATPVEPAVDRVTPSRLVAATLVRAACTVIALLLVLAALVLVVQAGRASGLVRFVDAAAGRLDLGVFDVDNGVMRFGGQRADLKDALFNRGIAALVWLGAGRVLGRLIEPVFERGPDPDSVTVR